jgi:hypothetical protein
MITNTGKQILAKYLISQTPSYASHIAIGCGARPVASTESTADYSAQEALEFEMFRVPIISRGYVTLEDGTPGGTPNVVFTAELPTAERYEITEVGIYPAASNSAAVGRDSRVLYAFTTTESWQNHTPASATAIPVISTQLDPGNDDEINLSNYGNPKVFQTNADNKTFTSLDRLNRYENCRFYNNIVVLRGDHGDLGRVTITNAVGNGSLVEYTTAIAHDLEVGTPVTVYGIVDTGSLGTLNIFGSVVSIGADRKTFKLANTSAATYSSGGYSTAKNTSFINTGSSHVHLTGISLNLDNNENDELRFAFSVINKDGSPAIVSNPDSIRILIEFRSTEGSIAEDAIQYANLSINLENGGAYNNDANTVNFSDNRYFVIKAPIDELEKSIGFTWASVDVVKITATAIVDDAPSEDFYICLDALRVENVSTKNPLYGLTGYSVVKTQNAETIVKAANTTNYVEFRFGFGVDQGVGA